MTDQDTRVQCIACAHYRAGMCFNAAEARWWPAGKSVHEVGPELAVLKQHCPGHKPLDDARNRRMMNP